MKAMQPIITFKIDW